MGSPRHSSATRHSRNSSACRFSGSLKGKISPNDPTLVKGQKQYDSIEEEGLLDDEERKKGVPRRCYFLAFVVAFIVLFTLFSLILWGASKPQKPKITMRSITFERFSIQAGSDDSGVATDMISVNSTLKFTYRNTGTFFGTHVTSTPITLSYSKLTVATGTLKKFYQSRKSQRLVTVTVSSSRIPLYGSGAGMSSSQGIPTPPVLLNLSFTARSRAFVLGKMVKHKFNKRIECSVSFDSKQFNNPISLKNSCTVND